MTKDTGGSAFPRPASIDPEYDARVPSQEGMTLRDYFAAKAMQAIIIAKPEQVQIGGWPVYAEETAYLIADAMLKARR